MVGYLLVTAVIMFPMRANLEGWPVYFTLHVVGAALMILLGRASTIRWTVAAFARRTLPIFLAPFIYSEMAALNDLFFPQTYFDEVVVGWELSVFGENMALTLRDHWARGLLSEYLHFAYFSYYFLPLMLWGSLALQRRWRANEEFLTVLSLSFVTCMMWFLLFPVAGPYHHFGPADPEAMGRVFPPLVHSVIESGSSQGTAFPSSHVAVAGVVLLMALLRDRRRMGPVMIFLVPALALGAIYGGFHYAIDALVGAIWAVLATVVGLALFRRLRPETRIEPESNRSSNAEARSSVSGIQGSR
jgi:membrane-associated phospholipid phosphatase